MDPFSNRQLSYRSYVKTIRAFSNKPVTQTSTALILTLATIAFFGLAAIRPTLATISELQADIKEKEETLEKIQIKLNSLNSIQKELQANREAYGNFDKAIPDNQEVSQMLTKIEILAEELGLPLQNVRVSQLVVYGTPEKDPDEIQEDFDSYVIDVTITAAYEPLIKFISEMDTIERYGKIESINFAEPADDELENMLTLTMRARYYWNNEKEPEREVNETI